MCRLSSYGTVHILRHPPRGREGVLEKMTKDDRGRGGIWSWMTASKNLNFRGKIEEFLDFDIQFTLNISIKQTKLYFVIG